MLSETSVQPQARYVKEAEDFQTHGLAYALITPARNEAAFIEQAIESVVAQTAPPIKWVIVSDGSTDGTDDIVKKHADRHQWIELVRMPERRERHFAGKVHAFRAGYARLAGLDYDVVGNLDADITFDPEYFAFLLGKFAQNPRLGVAGTPFTDSLRQYNYNYASVEHVSGACQLFRRECFEDIGGYTPIRTGGIDLVAVTTARMKGWQTRSFIEKSCFHDRTIGSAKHRILRRYFEDGRSEYILGCDPLWESIRCIYWARQKPVVLSGALALAGFAWAAINRTPRSVSDEFVRFRRSEQRRRLRALFMKSLFWRERTGVGE